MPSFIPDYQIQGAEIQKIVSEQITRDDILGFTYIPYYAYNINCSSLAPETRNAISSKYTGCWMVAWQEQNEQIYVGHVHKGTPYDCGQLCIKTLCNNSKRSFVFRPSDVVPTPTDEEDSFSIYGIILFDREFEHLKAYGVYKDLNGVVQIKEQVYDDLFKGHLVIINQNESLGKL